MAQWQYSRPATELEPLVKADAKWQGNKKKKRTSADHLKHVSHIFQASLPKYCSWTCVWPWKGEIGHLISEQPLVMSEAIQSTSSPYHINLFTPLHPRMLLVPVIICSEIPGRKTNRVTAAHLHYNRRGLWLPEENLNNSGLSDALVVLVHTKTSVDLGNSAFKITHCPRNFCSSLCRIMHCRVMKKRKMTGTVPIKGCHCQFCHPLISSTTRISMWPLLTYHNVYLGRLSCNKQHTA